MAKQQAPELTRHDRTLLEFLAEHRIVRANQIAQLLGVTVPSAQRRLRRLGAGGYVAAGQLYAEQPKHYRVTGRGLRATGSDLGTPRLDQLRYRHDVGLAWLWLAARTGRFGNVTAMYSERRMRSEDLRPGPREQFGVQVIGEGPSGGVVTHYPDLLLQTAAGSRVAVELELTAKPRARLERIIGRYACDRRFDAVLYLVDDPRRAEQIRGAAARVGASRFVHVQRVEWTEHVGPPRDSRVTTRPLARQAGRGVER